MTDQKNSGIRTTNPLLIWQPDWASRPLYQPLYFNSLCEPRQLLLCDQKQQLKRLLKEEKKHKGDVKGESRGDTHQADIRVLLLWQPVITPRECCRQPIPCRHVLNAPQKEEDNVSLFQRVSFQPHCLWARGPENTLGVDRFWWLEGKSGQSWLIWTARCTLAWSDEYVSEEREKYAQSPEWKGGNGVDLGFACGKNSFRQRPSVHATPGTIFCSFKGRVGRRGFRSHTVVVSAKRRDRSHFRWRNGGGSHWPFSNGSLRCDARRGLARSPQAKWRYRPTICAPA